ncbi:MAG TPA: hypothetical protein VGN52_10270, partial [Burkholderiales bacterium]
RLDRLNEQHYAKLEKAGRLPTLEEIERMDEGAEGELAPAEESPENADTASGPNVFSQKPGDSWGTAVAAAAPGSVFSEKAGGLWGPGAAARLQPQTSPWLLHNPPPAAPPHLHAA